VLPPEIAESALATYRRCVAAGTTIGYFTSYEMRLGRREFEGSLTPIRHPDSDRIVRLVGGLRDVTERNRMQAALFQGQKMEAIGRLAAGVAHDFNNILQSIFGALEMVLEEMPADTPLREFAAVALRSAERGASLTHHLLSFARKQALRPTTIDLAALFNDIQTLLVRTLGPHIAVRLRVDRRSPAVHADPGQLQTALLNLAINAAHAMPQGGTLAIEVRPEFQANQFWVTIAVTDTGIGMDAATLAQATEPFFTTKGVGGSGLGLSMVQGFAEQSGGRLTIESKLGDGTTVELHLPAAMSVQPQLADPTASQAPQFGRLLVVDDDRDVIATMGAFLEAAGFQIVRAHSGDEALALMNGDDRFDAIVTDYAMPGLNGMDLISEVRRLRADLPAILVSGFIDVTHVGTPAERTITLHKPFMRQQLIDALRQVMAAAPTLVTRPAAQT
jgi:signal transduction histidine kinase/CheY-like chemotaxis protein